MSTMLKNYWKISMISLLSLLTGCSDTMSKNDTKFEWDATESAPKYYPMEIIRGTFVYHGEKERGLYIPSGGTLKAGWGQPISSHDVGEAYKALPDRLKITFFSYAEKQFYQGEFELPYEKILTLFREGVAANARLPTYSRIMAGIAPGGVVVVWLTGQVTTEIFVGQAEKVELDPGRAFALPFTSKEQSDAYIAKQLVNVLTPEELDSLKQNGIPFGLWSRYRNHYDWYPVLIEGRKPDNTDVKFVNGEYIGIWDFDDAKALETPRPVPKRMSFIAILNGKKTIYQMSFDEFETMAAFEQLGSNGEKVYLEFDPKMPRSQTRVRLYNDEESIVLKKTISKDW